MNKDLVRKHLFGLILSGGKSSRMGFDKGTISFHGKTQYQFLADLLKIYCEQTFVSCKTTAGIPTGLNLLPDRFDIQSPLNGILTAFDYRSDVAWLTVPVDMPGLESDVLGYLLQNRDENSLATCFYDDEGKLPEPLVTIWEPHSYPSLKTFYAQGKISPRDFLMQSKIKLIQPMKAGFHLNINTPDELKNYEDKKGPHSP
jgi:molybdenum cofactor guanylyltransferase